MSHPVSFISTQNEKRILQYLFQTKVATFSQIHKHLFGNVVKSTVSKRLRRLLNSHFIVRGITDFKGKATQIFSLTPKTVDLLHSDEADLIERYQVQSGATDHDLLLSDIRNKFFGYSEVSKYWMENELQCLKESIDDPKLAPYVLLRSDAVLEISSNGKKMIIPLELEISQKANSRYEEKLKAYYKRENLHCVLFISGSPQIQKTVIEIDQQVCGERRSIFYYADLENVLSDERRIEFTNLKKDKFVLK